VDNPTGLGRGRWLFAGRISGSERQKTQLRGAPKEQVNKSEKSMERWSLAIASKLWPELETMGPRERAGGVFEIFGFLYSAPLALVGFVWLIAITDLHLIRLEWLTLLFLFALLFLFRRFDFFFFIETQPGAFAHFASSFEPIITWSAVLIFGPSGLWMTVLWDLIDFARQWRQASSTRVRWNLLRNLTLEITGLTLISLIALTLYQYWGGTFPFPGLMLDGIKPAFYAMLVDFLLSLLIYVPLLVYTATTRNLVPTSDKDSPWVSAIAVGLTATAGGGFLVGLYAILAAGLYVQNGPIAYFFLIAGLLMVGWLTHRLSQTIERSQQRSRELANLEQLGRAILRAPADASTLPDVLQEHVSGMFSRSQIEIRLDRNPLFPDHTILHAPDDWPPVDASVWEWLRANPQASHFLPGATLPWNDQLDADTAVALIPILDTENSEPIGGIYLSRRWDPTTIASLQPAAQSLAAQIASALHRAKTYQVEQEMAVAGKIQASFLPDELPHIPGWQLAATLEPARETSGDFYDVIPLPNNQLGILVADVADKGTGAALYMALSRTLIRTYAPQYHSRPDYVLKVANRRILTDTRTDLFVTVFYGIIDTITGTLTYCNAGHNPPYLFSVQNDSEAQALTKTGMALGVLEDATWEQRTIQLAPGDLLVLYTDGITDAENGQGAFFGEERLLKVTRANLERTAQDVHHALMTEVHRFVGDAPQFDDITLMIVVRSSTEQQ
jgi:serine phosphatase RsbU (regulator of sigma subunit)